MSIYEPAEDSFLMSGTLALELPKLLELNSDLKFLEVGCGSGINLEAAKKAGVKEENILGSDINLEAVKHCKKLGFNCIKSDLFSNIKGKFDVIAFNPPYLPEDDREPLGSRRETTAGKKGNEIIIKFLKQAKKHLANNGMIYLIKSSLGKSIDLGRVGYKVENKEVKRLFFEQLFLWKIKK